VALCNRGGGARCGPIAAQIGANFSTFVAIASWLSKLSQTTKLISKRAAYIADRSIWKKSCASMDAEGEEHIRTSTASLSSSYKPQYTPHVPGSFFMMAASSAPTSPKELPRPG
jgi:hypothetical protein